MPLFVETALGSRGARLESGCSFNALISRIHVGIAPFQGGYNIAVSTLYLGREPIDFYGRLWYNSCIEINSEKEQL